MEFFNSLNSIWVHWMVFYLTIPLILIGVIYVLFNFIFYMRYKFAYRYFSIIPFAHVFLEEKFLVNGKISAVLYILSVILMAVLMDIPSTLFCLVMFIIRLRKTIPVMLEF